MRLRSRAVASVVFFLLSAAVVIAVTTRVFAPAADNAAPVDRWEQADSVEAGVEYVIVSNGYALTSELIDCGDEYSLAGRPVTTTDGVLGGEVDGTMLWRFSDDTDTCPGDTYYADGDMYITHGGFPLARDTSRGEEYLRLYASEPYNPDRSPEYYSWRLIKKGDGFFLASATGSPETYNLLYYSKYYGVFIYLKDYSDMTQRLCAVKLFRFVAAGDKSEPIEEVSLILDPPTAGRPALNAYKSEALDSDASDSDDAAGYRVVSTDWSGDPAVFAYSTEYTATVTLRACAGYTFAENATVTVNGRPVHASVSGGVMTLRLNYPVTSAGRTLAVVTDSLLITSDLHKHTDNLERFLTLLSAGGMYPGAVYFGGDMYTGGGGYFYTGWKGYVQSVRGIIAGIFPAAEPVFTMGNHDWESLYDENFTGGELDDVNFADIYGFARVGAIYPGGDRDAPYVIFNIGATDVTYGEYYSMFRDEDLAKLERFLDETDGSGKIIFINSHWPLHYAYNSGDREVAGSEKMIDLLNEYATRNDIVFTWGHNHSGDPSMLTVRVAGDEIICDKASMICRRIKFTYANAGAMIKGTGLFVSFDGDFLTLTYYSLPSDGSDVLIPVSRQKISRVD